MCLNRWEYLDGGLVFKFKIFRTGPTPKRDSDPLRAPASPLCLGGKDGFATTFKSTLSFGWTAARMKFKLFRDCVVVRSSGKVNAQTAIDTRHKATCAGH
jgi:hypothetical protein